VEDARALDTLNERVLSAVNAGGRYFISSTRLNGAYSLRVCVLGYRTTAEDIRGLIGDIERLVSGELVSGGDGARAG
jgi:aromatic-L-amino-acid decarboxylase